MGSLLGSLLGSLSGFCPVFARFLPSFCPVFAQFSPSFAPKKMSKCAIYNVVTYGTIGYNIINGALSTNLDFFNHFFAHFLPILCPFFANFFANFLVRKSHERGLCTRDSNRILLRSVFSGAW